MRVFRLQGLSSVAGRCHLFARQLHALNIASSRSLIGIKWKLIGPNWPLPSDPQRRETTDEPRENVSELPPHLEFSTAAAGDTDHVTRSTGLKATRGQLGAVDLVPTRIAYPRTPRPARSSVRAPDGLPAKTNRRSVERARRRSSILVVL